MRTPLLKSSESPINIPIKLMDADGVSLNGVSYSDLEIKYRIPGTSHWITPTLLPGDEVIAIANGFIEDLDGDGIYWYAVPPVAMSVAGDLLIKWNGEGIESDELLIPVTVGISSFFGEIENVILDATQRVIVNSFTETARLQLVGSSISLTTPVPVDGRFCGAIIQGDSYHSGRHWKMTLTQFEGPNLESADSLTLVGNRFNERFTWAFEAKLLQSSDLGAGIILADYELSATLGSQETQVTAGEWNVALVARWEGSTESTEKVMTLIGPKAKLLVLSNG